MENASLSQSSHMHHMMPNNLDTKSRSLKIVGWITGIYFLVELSIGIWTNSVAVLSDAFHTFSAVGGVLVALIARHFSIKPATRFQTFGLLRAEIIGALFNGFFLLGMAVFILWMGYFRLQNAIDLPTTPMLFAAIGGLITEFIALKLLHKEQKNDLNMKGAYWHVIQTFIGSLIIIVAALVIRFTGFLPIDPLLGMAFGLILFWASWGIIRSSLHILLDSVPQELNLNQITNEVKKIAGVKNLHHVHAWSITTGKNIYSAHVLIEDSINIQEVQKQIHKILKNKFKIFFSTIQIETQCLEDKKAEEINFLSNN